MVAQNWWSTSVTANHKATALQTLLTAIQLVLSHGKTKLTHGKTQLTHGKTQFTHSKTKLTHGRTQPIHGIIIYKQQFLHSDWLRTCQLIPNQCKKV